MPEKTPGAEFTTAVPPDPDTPPHRCEWRGPRPGVATFVDDDGLPWARISVRVTRVVRDEDVQWP